MPPDNGDSMNEATTTAADETVRVQVPEVKAVEISPLGLARQAFTRQQAVTSVQLFVNGWSRPAKY